MINEFDLYRAKKVIRELANAKGIEEKEMRAEMEMAIEAGYSNPDPVIRMSWESSPFTVKDRGQGANANRKRNGTHKVD